MQDASKSSEAHLPVFDVFDTLHMLFENAPSFVALVTVPGYRYVFSNKKNRELLGRQDMLGRKVAEVVPELAQQGFLSILDAVCSSGEAYIGHAVPLYPHGSKAPLYLDFIYQPVFGDDGAITAIVLVGHDVTEHCVALTKIEALQSDLLLAAQELRGENARFRRTLDHLPHMIWSTRPDGYHDYYSKLWYEFTGVAEGVTDGEEWNEMFHPDDRARAWQLWRHSLETGEPYRIEYRLLHSSGNYRWVVGRAWPERNSAGEITRWYGTCTDIHERIVAQERVAELQSELMHLSRLSAMGSMATTLAHEVNQPLTAATNYVAGLRRLIERGAGQSELLTAVGLIENTTLRAGEIIRRLRDTTKRREPAKQRVPAADLVREASALAVAAGCGEVEPVLQFGDGIHVYADPIEVQQVLASLIKNACESVEKQADGEVLVSTSLSADQMVQFVVEDNGPGIPPELLPTVFEAFVTNKKNGSGIGLAVSRTIVESAGGRIWAENKPGGGAKFCFTLPA